MSAKAKGRPNQRAGLSEVDRKLRYCMYGKELFESPAIDALENFVYCVEEEKYGGEADILTYFKGITGQMEDTSDARKKIGFQIMVVAPLWRALIDNDAQFFSDLGDAVAQRAAKRKELPQHYKLLDHAMSPKNHAFSYSYDKIQNIVAPYGDLKVGRLLKDLGLTLFKGKLLSQVFTPEEKKRLKRP